MLQYRPAFYLAPRSRDDFPGLAFACPSPRSSKQAPRLSPLSVFGSKHGLGRRQEAEREFALLRPGLDPAQLQRLYWRFENATKEAT